MNCAARREPRLPELLRKMSPVDLVVVEGFKSEPHRKIEVHRSANGKPLLFPDDPAIVGIATDAAVETTLPIAHLDDIPAIAAMMRRSAISVEDVLARSRAKLRSKMAQLSDDCFAFGGPMMSVDEAVGIIAARVTAVQEIETVALGAADGRILARDIAAPLPLPPFTNSAVDGYAVRSRDLPREAEAAFPVTGRIQAGASAQAAIRPGHAMRIFTGAPMPEGADTVFMQEDVRIDETGRVVLPAGLKRGANVRPAGEDIAEGSCRAEGRPALAAAGCRACGRVRPDRGRGDAGASASRCSRPATNWSRPGGPRQPAQLFDSNRFMLMAMLGRLGCEVSDLGILRDDRASLAEALKQVAGRHDLLLTTGGVSTGEEDHVKAAVESVGSLVLWRMAIKPGRPVAMGIIGGTPFIGLPGNPVASFVTFVHVVRPTVLALAGATANSRWFRCRFAPPSATRRRSPAANMSGSPCARPADGALEATKFPREGAGLLSSLVDTDGLVELGEDVTQVEPGQSVGFLGYANLM